MLTFLSLKVLIRMDYRVGGCNSNGFLNRIWYFVQYQLSYHVMTCILSHFSKYKITKPHPQKMACTCAQSTMKIDIPVTRGRRKLNFVACKWNHKIYLSSRSQTPIVLGDQLQLNLFHQYRPPTTSNHSGRLEIVSLLRLD